MEENTNPHNPNPASTDASGDILEELRELGRNLQAMVQTMWESEERKKLEHELETGLTEAYNSLSKAAHEFAESPTGKNIKTELEDLGQRIRSGEVEAKVRSEILSALKSANEGLKRTNPPQSASTPSSDSDEKTG
jgi:hypothetical protein